MSGFVIYRNNTIRDRKSTITFFRKRVLRIYPLYWVALVILFFASTRGVISNQAITNHTIVNNTITNYNLSPSTIVINIVGAQGIASPRFVAPNLVLWFIGIILLFYLLYPLIAYFSYSVNYMVFAIVGSLAIFVLLHAFLGLVDFRFFVFYGTFVAGILSSKFGIFYGTNNKRFTSPYVVAVFLVATLALVLIANSWLFLVIDIVVPSIPHLSISVVVAIVISNILVFLLAYFIFKVLRLFVPRMSAKALKLISALSFATYAVYLFNRPFLGALEVFLAGSRLTPFVSDILIILCGLPLLFLFSYIIQSAENGFISALKRARPKIARQR